MAITQKLTTAFTQKLTPATTRELHIPNIGIAIQMAKNAMKQERTISEMTIVEFITPSPWNAYRSRFFVYPTSKVTQAYDHQRKNEELLKAATVTRWQDGTIQVALCGSPDEGEQPDDEEETRKEDRETQKSRHAGDTPQHERSYAHGLRSL